VAEKEPTQCGSVASARLKTDAVYSFAAMGTCPLIVGVAGAAVFYCRPCAFVAQVVLLVLPDAVVACNAG